MSSKDSTIDLPDEDSTIPVGKGRPTPKRKEQEAANRRPLVGGTKEDAKARKEASRAQRAKENAALMSGDDRNMPLEHRGPERRWIRDFIDARSSAAEWAMPVMLGFVVLTLFVGSSAIGTILILGFYIVLLGMAIEVWMITRSLKKHFETRFGVGRMPRGWRLYAITRAMNLRRMRVPKPKVKRGEYPS
ncbi:DUF3043 domain-containing protein [Demequina capsici]|uniref:DUF3043 domain-containing protein n=1 Tax=Demequina capsici TaxID=3075620 RepID=A0AA96FAA9_9MICO|nr:MULTISPECIES: DUF3043 domain-containing protein [unclassified Demequina]WNM25667.1 DUF3043 domain-containing protein [Demequina sp. OYTSA14]WNM28562.1 DUF3043 domain-containing protein [Demequina sp. PMTSA13]